MGPRTELPEITETVDLCDAKGRLNRGAVGWTRTPLHRPNLSGWGRTKRWEYWGLVTPTHILGLTISSLDYAGVESIYVLDRQTTQETVTEATVPLARGVTLAEASGVGSSRYTSGRLSIAFDEVEDGTRIRAATGELSLRVSAGKAKKTFTARLSGKAQITVSKKLAGRLRRARKLKLRVAYAGDAGHTGAAVARRLKR